MRKKLIFQKIKKRRLWDRLYVDSADRTEQARREEETKEINNERRGDHASSEWDQEDSSPTARPAPQPQPWDKSTEMTICNDYLNWIVTKYNSKRSLIEQTRSLPQDQRKEIDEQNPEIDDVLLKITEHALQINEYFHLMRVKLSSPSNNLYCMDNSNAALATWLEHNKSDLFVTYQNFYNSRTHEEFQTTCFSRWFLEPEYCREQAYQAFITQLTTEHEIGSQYWPYKRLLQEWKTQAATAPWAQPLEKEPELRTLLANIPVKRQVFFNKIVGILGDAVKTAALSDKLSMLCPAGTLENNDPRKNQWGPRLRKEVLPALSNDWLNQNPGNPFYDTIHRKLLVPERPITWSSKEEWAQWNQEFKKSSALIQEVIKKKTDLLDDWENWREESYASLSSHKAELQRAADIWKDQVEAIHDELTNLSKTAQKIREGEHEITSSLPIKQAFETLFKTTFRHLHRISTHIENASPSILEPLFAQESKIKIFLATWQDDLERNSHELNFIPFNYQMQIGTVIAATETLALLVNQHQDKALHLRYIAEEERQQQQSAAAVKHQNELLLLAPTPVRNKLINNAGGDETDREEITPMHESDKSGGKPPYSPEKTHFPFPETPKIIPNDITPSAPSAPVNRSSTSLL